jgi:glutamate-1-semialdehyde aminotransferase
MISRRIIEPVPSIFPVDLGDFLGELREVTRDSGVLLIFDEVISGFRLSYGGAQAHFGVTPDIATYGKIIGGGLPVGAIAGSLDALQPLVTTGNLIQDVLEKVLIIGTFSGNPLTTSVGAVVVQHLRDHPEIYDHIDGLAARVKREIHEFCRENGFELRLLGLGSWFLPQFIDSDPKSPRDLRGLDNIVKGEILGNYMRYHGVYMPDLHTVFLSAVHTEEDADRIVAAFKASLVDMKQDGVL